MLHAMLLKTYADIAKELGVAPGGEFRRAYQEVATFIYLNFLTFFLSASQYFFYVIYLQTGYSHRILELSIPKFSYLF